MKYLSEHEIGSKVTIRFRYTCNAALVTWVTRRRLPTGRRSGEGNFGFALFSGTYRSATNYVVEVISKFTFKEEQNSATSVS
jgi:hypothetical protein